MSARAVDRQRWAAYQTIRAAARFERWAGWDLVVVFDGAPPPGKAHASSSRSGDRANAIEACGHLQAQRPVNRTELEKHATRAAKFTPTTVARVAKMLRHSLRADCIAAPFEVYSQLKVIEGLYSGSVRRCFVRANDSDFTVLIVRSVIWDVNMENGGLFGQCIRFASVSQPRDEVFSDFSIQYDFLRRLHGVGTSAIDEHVAPAWSTDGEAVMARLRNFACVAGNDYSKFKGIEPMRAMDIAFSFGNALSTLDVAMALAANTSSQTEVVLPQLKTSMDVFCHAVVWGPLTGTHRHLSGVEACTDITSNTGTLASPATASKIATRQIGPKPREPWAKSASASMEGLPYRRMPPVGGGRAGREAPSRGGRAGRGASGRGGRARQRTKRDPPLGGAEGNNYRQTGGFGNLPGADMDNSTWTMEQLNGFLSAFRCLEMSGVNKFCKAELVTLAKTCVEVVRQAGLEGSEFAFRHPVMAAPAPHQAGTLPPPETVWQGWEALRDNLPDLSHSIIIK
eukprot:jgi/Undpi1/9777/HiC_scaffold_27.g12233.m1